MVSVYREKKGEILHWGEMQREAITKICSRFLQGGSCVLIFVLNVEEIN